MKAIHMPRTLAGLLVLFMALFRVRVDREEVLTPDEEASLDETLGDALRADGSIDHARLRQRWDVVDPDTWQRKASHAERTLAADRQP